MNFHVPFETLSALQPIGNDKLFTARCAIPDGCSTYSSGVSFPFPLSFYPFSSFGFSLSLILSFSHYPPPPPTHSLPQNSLPHFLSLFHSSFSRFSLYLTLYFVLFTLAHSKRHQKRTITSIGKFSIYFYQQIF